jgi:cysteine synthase B
MTVLDVVGNTPLLELRKISKDAGGAQILAKAEFFNPSGSVKDRAAKAMILDGIKSGKLTAGKTIIDATSGNTGIAYAMLGAALGFGVTLYLPANASAERKKIIKSYNARIVETNPLESSDGAFLAAKAEYESAPEKYFYPNQYNNDVNWKTHYETTGVEIWEQSEKRVTHFVSGMGTSGTFTGVSRRLKEFNKDTGIFAVQPDSPFHGIEGTKHMESTIKPGFYDESLAHNVIEIDTESAYGMAKRLAREEGLFVGISSGANVFAALTLAKTLPKDSCVVTILCDGGLRYLSETFWEDAV